jgi:hypothetical protein
VALEKLSITPCTSSGSAAGSAFTVLMNPTAFDHEHSIRYQSAASLGTSSPEQKFNAYRPERVSFEIDIDGTGVANAEVNGGSGAPPDDAKVQVDKLKAVVYTFDGNKHEPNYVKLSWGNFSFLGRLDKLAVNYNLFKPTGQPLRAKVKMSFVGTTSPSDEAASANKSSPDLSHLIEVKSGDTLPLLCYRIYKDSSYYLEVARINGLVNFRSLTPGAWLKFPPLR